MSFSQSTICPSRTGRRLFALLMISVLLLPLLAAVPSPSGTLPAQPLLLQAAAARPDTNVRVVVHKVKGASGIEEAITRLGGAVVHDLHMINALAAELPGRAVPALAREQGIRWLSLDAPVLESDHKSGHSSDGDSDDSTTTDSLTGGCYDCPVDTTDLLNWYIDAIGADRLWNKEGAPYLQGQDVTVAVIDSGVNDHKDLRRGWDKLESKESRIIAMVKFNSKTNSSTDEYGHGTHIGGIIGGNGLESAGAHIGVAPKVNLVSIKVSDDKGAGVTSDVVAGLQWIYENRDHYNIRVVNVSLNSGAPASYHESPLNAALEILWFSGIVVVVSGGNNGATENGTLYPPANDPFVISVGASDQSGMLAGYSAYGTTESGYNKPDLVAPGSEIVSTLAHKQAKLAQQHPDHLTKEDSYFWMSGTSMAAAVTTGAVALLLQAEPDLTPDQVKYRLMSTARPMDQPGSGAGHLDIYNAVQTPTTESANTGIEASQLLWSGDEPVTWDSVNWNSVNWNSVNWNSVNWSSVNWNSVNWNNVHWEK